jgi:hypothetical protein
LIYVASWEDNEAKVFGNALMRIPIAGGPARKLSDAFVFATTFSPDGRKIAALTFDRSDMNPGSAIDVFSSSGRSDNQKAPDRGRAFGFQRAAVLPG